MYSYLRFFIAIVLFCVCCMGLTSIYVSSLLTNPVSATEGQVYQIRPGMGFAQVMAELDSQGVLDDSRALQIYARVTGLAANIKAGEYEIEPGDTVVDLFDKFARGDIIQYQLTVIEGWTFSQFRQLLTTQEKLEQTLSGLTDQQIMARLGFPDQHPEGRFFPDSYAYHAGSTDLEILQRAYQRLQLMLQQAWENRQPDLPYANPYEALIMASIVERETGVPEERETIAGVFVRRLQKGMRLQTDPTVIYGLGDAYQGNIKRSHLRQPTPYNTYVIRGLPPTPIALPGKGAIEAAVNPEPGTSLYFVARGDGSHEFSDTLQDHNRAVQKYQVKERRINYRSSPTKLPQTAQGAEADPITQ